jgi:hypothetical protein
MDDERHGKRDEIAFRGEQLGAAKTRAEEIGHSQRAAFANMLRTLRAWAADGIQLEPAQISFSDPVDEAAWRRFCAEPAPARVEERNPWALPPMMDHEDDTIESLR